MLPKTTFADEAEYLAYLRDYFAGQALIACADHDYGNDWGKSGTEYPQRAASRAYRLADAMLRERGK